MRERWAGGPWLSYFETGEVGPAGLKKASRPWDCHLPREMFQSNGRSRRRRPSDPPVHSDIGTGELHPKGIGGVHWAACIHVDVSSRYGHPMGERGNGVCLSPRALGGTVPP